MSSNASSPNVEGHVGWVPPPRGRGTINIIWSCLSVLLICSYKCLHLNIPADDELEAGWHTLGGIIPYWPERPKLRSLLRKLKWMAIIILAPEMGVGIAASQFFNARSDVAKATKKAPDFASWLSSRDRTTAQSADQPIFKRRDTVSGPKDVGFTLTHAFYARMGGFLIFTPGTDEQGRTFVHRKRICYLEDYASFLSTCDPERRQASLVSEAEIQALGKSDSLTKALAVWQALYLVLDCAARTGTGLPISALELSTAGYVLAAAIMYVFWWLKPQDVAHITVLYDKKEELSQETIIAHTANEKSNHRARNLESDEELDIIFFGKAEASFAFHLSAASFGAVHVTAWHWDFGSVAMLTIWRLCSVLSTTMPIIIVLCFFVEISGEEHVNKIMKNATVSKVVKKLGRLSTIRYTYIYITARLCLIVLSFYSLASMPAALYKTVEWTDYLPFIS